MMSKPALLVVPISVALLAAACGGGQPGGTPAPTATTTPTQAPTSTPSAPATGRLAFAYNPTGEETPLDGASMPNYEIYLVNADGSDLTRLTNDPGADGSPAWSPDGRRIAFSRASVEGDIESSEAFIYVMNADGTGEARLAEGLLPTWSPDGSRIAFISGDDTEWDVYVMNADGSGQTKLTAGDGTDVFGEPMVGFKPNPWSPDGKQLAFNRTTFLGPGETEGQVKTSVQIYVVNPDGSGQKSLTDTEGFFAGWSPDGKKVLFLSTMGADNEEERLELRVVGADGSGEKPLLELPGENPQGFPVWSPDGTRIAFTADRGGKDVIYVMNADGSDVTPVTSGAGEGCDGLYGTSWSPDGQQLAFARGCWDGDAEVWVVNADGTGERHLAGTAGARPTQAALNPVWSPMP